MRKGKHSQISRIMRGGVAVLSRKSAVSLKDSNKVM